MSQQLLLREIFTRLQKLVKEHEQLKKETARLHAELEKKKQQQRHLAATEQQLKDQVAILQTTSQPMDEAGKKILEKRINEYIRNIDKAIALLNE